MNTNATYIHTQTHIHIEKHKQKWNYLVKQFMLYLFRSHHSKAQQHRISFLNYIFQLQNKSSELKDAIWQFLANHGAGKSSTHNNALFGHLSYTCSAHTKATHPRSWQSCYQEEFGYRNSNDSLCISEALLKKQTNTLLF